MSRLAKRPDSVRASDEDSGRRAPPEARGGPTIIAELNDGPLEGPRIEAEVVERAGIHNPVDASRILDALRDDAGWLGRMARPEQRALLAGRDPRDPSGTATWARFTGGDRAGPCQRQTAPSSATTTRCGAPAARGPTAHGRSN